MSARAPSEPLDPATEPWVLKEQADGVVTLRLNRPGQLNALSVDMITAVQERLAAIAAEERTRVVVITGVGKAFSAGHNLKEMRANYTRAYQQKLFERCSEMMLSIHRLPQPVIAAVNGLATAAGCQLVATCDLAVAAQTARFATSGINVGLFCSTPAVAVSRTVSRKHALQLLLTGDFIDADRAYEIGLVNQVVAPDALEAAVGELAAKLAAKSAHALRLGKAAFYRQLEVGVSDAYALAGTTMADNMMDRDAAEGIDAFIEKRAPSWDHRRR